MKCNVLATCLGACFCCHCLSYCSCFSGHMGCSATLSTLYSILLCILLIEHFGEQVRLFKELLATKAPAGKVIFISICVILDMVLPFVLVSVCVSRLAQCYLWRPLASWLYSMCVLLVLFATWFSFCLSYWFESWWLVEKCERELLSWWVLLGNNNLLFVMHTALDSYFDAF